MIAPGFVTGRFDDRLAEGENGKIARNNDAVLFDFYQYYYIFVCLVLHPRSNGTVKVLFMEKVRLKVLTVPALDPITYQEHMTFCVSTENGGQLQHAPGWTLRDAIDTYCEWFKVDRNQIALERPFFPQRALSDEGYRQ